MGITTDQHTRTHLNRLQRHYKAMKENEGRYDQEEFELHAWAFSRVLINSEYLKHLLQHLLHCHQHRTTIWDLDAGLAEEFPEENEAPPIWALELVELVLRASALMCIAAPDHNTEFYGAEDALNMIENWRPFKGRTNEILLTIREEDYEIWSRGYDNPHCWLGFPKFLNSL